MPPLRGDLISLRLVRRADIDGLIDLLNDLGTRGALGHFLKSETDISSRFERDGYWSEDSGVLLMIDVSGGIVGWIGFIPVIYYFYGYEISYQVFGEQYSGKGYATEALALLTEYLFSTKPMGRLQAQYQTGQSRIAAGGGEVWLHPGGCDALPRVHPWPVPRHGTVVYHPPDARGVVTGHEASDGVTPDQPFDLRASG